MESGGEEQLEMAKLEEATEDGALLGTGNKLVAEGERGVSGLESCFVVGIAKLPTL